MRRPSARQSEENPVVERAHDDRAAVPSKVALVLEAAHPTAAGTAACGSIRMPRKHAATAGMRDNFDPTG